MNKCITDMGKKKYSVLHKSNLQQIDKLQIVLNMG